MPVQINHRADDRLDTYDIDVLAVPAEARPRGVYPRPHPYDAHRVILETWDGFGDCLDVSSVRVPVLATAKAARWAFLESVERDRIALLG